MKKAFMEFRAMIPKDIYDALKEEAVKILENIDTVVEEGTYVNSWKPWSDRIITCTTIDDVNDEFKTFNESMKELTDMHKEYKNAICDEDYDDANEEYNHDKRNKLEMENTMGIDVDVNLQTDDNN